MVEMEKILSKNFIPKKDTQQEEFLQKYPNYDGRGIKIAIIDTGVDVSLDGLQKTSTGLPKIIDCFDFTGAGDVDTTTVKKIGKSRILTLLSGRVVKIPRDWKNPFNQWHLGVKPVFEILPPPNKDEDENDKSLQEYDNDIIKQFKAISPEILFLKDYKVDFIVWNNGQKWQACIIAPETVNLESSKILTNFHDSHDNCLLLDNTSFAITIHNNGNLLEIFVPYACHGSAVAQVAAAHVPGQPEKDGIAPGAQIFSMNVINRNSEIDSFALMKALNKCIEIGVDIINLSLCPNYLNESVIQKLIKKIVNEHGIIITQCIGNNGPFISSFESNIKLFEEILYIGSVFTQNVNSIFIKDVEDYPPFIWNYSSRGPSSTGSRGVTCVAPADAIVENPRWNSKKKRIFDGTSCAAPNAAGAIACLLSGLKANSIPYSPATVKMALSNTAFLPDDGDQLGFGNGIIQISSAFKYLKNHKEVLSKIFIPQISVNKLNDKGIIIYKLKNILTANEYCINVEYPQNEILWILKLSPENHNHIEHSNIVTENSFNIKINTESLEPGKIYYSEIHGYDPLNLLMGPFFCHPITVIVPENVSDNFIQKEIFIQPPSIFQLILHPPINSLKCTVKLLGQKKCKIEFKKVIKKDELNYSNRYNFQPPEAAYKWSIDIKWKNVFEIYIYQTIFIKKNIELKADLQICFD